MPMPDLLPYVVVANPGFEDEFVISEHRTFDEASAARRNSRNDDFDTDVMKRCSDGSLTTEF